MEKINLTAIFMACIVMVSTLAGMSLTTKPSTVEASDIHEPVGEEPGTITVIGFDENKSEPDLVVIYLRILARDKDSAAEAKDQVAEIIDKVINDLKALGLTDDEIETASYNIQQEYEWVNNSRVFKGYLVTCSIKVTIKDFDKAGKVIDASVDAGALVDSIDFEFSKEKQDEIKTQVMAEAAKDAKEKAEGIVSALGQQLGKVKSVSPEYAYQPYRYWSYDNVMGLEKSAPPTIIMPEDLTVSSTLTVVFEIL